MKHLPLLLSPALLILAGAASADTIQVPKDFATIQAAVTAAQTGDTIAVSPGLYRENVLVTTSGITLKGRDAIIDGAYLGTCLDVQADDVTISGLEFVNGGTAAALGLLAGGGGLSVVGSNASIINCEASGCTSFGISLVGNGELDDNFVAACMGPGIVVDTNDQGGERTVLNGNQVYHCASGILADDGPFLFTKNTVARNSGNGIHLTILAAGSVTATMPTELKRNKCEDNAGTGLLVLDEVGAVQLIDGSHLTINDVGLDLTGDSVTVSGNDISFNRKVGAWLKTDSATFEDNRVRRNTLCGIEVLALGGAADGLNKLIGNRVEANGGDGIHVSSGGNILDHNVMRDNKGDGVQVVSGAVANTLLENVAQDNQHDGFDNWGTNTLLRFNTSEGNFGADLAGIGDGSGTVAATSMGNVQGDDSGLTTKQELELDTMTP